MHFAISLNLPHDLLQKLKSTVHFNSSVVCLNTVLWEWVSRRHKHAKSPTPENLKRALRGYVVQLGDVANRLEKEFLEHGVHLIVEELSPCTKKSRLDSVPFEEHNMDGPLTKQPLLETTPKSSQVKGESSPVHVLFTLQTPSQGWPD